MVVETYLKAALSISIFLIAVSGVAASAPTEAIDPNPVDGAIDVPVDANLSWSRGEGAVQDEVYLGTDPCALPLVAAIMNLPPFPPLYNPPGDLVASTTYYWQIVEVNDPNEYPGPVWSFSTIRGEAQCEYPEDGAVIDGDIAGDNIWTKLIFIPGATAVEHTGYFSDNCRSVRHRGGSTRFLQVILRFPLLMRLLFEARCTTGLSMRPMHRAIRIPVKSGSLLFRALRPLRPARLMRPWM
ncbi:MAG: Ig-like domain-containing domain [Planctomycetota bacterium]